MPTFVMLDRLKRGWIRAVTEVESAVVPEIFADDRFGQPDPVVAERFRLTVARIAQGERIRMLLSFAVGAILVVEALARGVFDYPWSAAFALLLTVSTAWTVVSVNRAPRAAARSLDDAPHEWLGRYRPEDIRELLDEAAAPYLRELAGATPVLRVKPGGADECFTCSGRGLWRRGDTVFVTSGILQILRPEELRASLAHELAHFHDLPQRTAVATPALALLLLGATFWISVPMETLASGYGVMPVAFGFWFAFMRVIVPALLGGGLHEREHLCDLAAGRHFGAVAMINALLKLGLSQEIVIANQQEIADALDADLGLEPVATIAAVRAGSPLGLVPIADVRLRARETIAALRRPWRPWLCKHDRRLERTKFVAAVRAQAKADGEVKRLDWGRFEDVIRTGSLDARQCAELVAALVADPAADLVQVCGPSGPDTHPTFRNRILFLAATLPLDDRDGPLAEATAGA